MESLAYIHNAVAYESDEPLPEMQLALPSSAWIATSSLTLSLLLVGLPQDALATVTGVVQTGGSSLLNVRNAPNGDVVTTIQNGATLELTGQTQDGWLETTDGNWVMAQYVESAPTAAAANPDNVDPNAQQQATAAPRVAYVNTNGASLNVRSEPDGSIVRTVDDGSQLQLSGRSDSGWLETADGNWVVAQFVQSTQPNGAESMTTTAQSPDLAASPSPAVGGAAQTGVVSTGGSPLNIRQTPDGEVVGQLQDGSQVELTGREQDGWVERVGGTWLQADFVERSPQATAQSPSPTPEATAQSPSPTPEATAQSPSPTPEATAPSPAPTPETTAQSPAPTPETTAPSPAATPSPSPSPSPTPSPQPSPAAQAPAPSPSPQPQPAAQAPSPAPSPAPQAPAQAPSPAPSPEPQATAQTPASAPPAEGSDVQAAVVRTNGSPLLVRSSPGGAVVGSLSNGTGVELTGRSDGSWVERTNGTWISGDWISTSDPANPQPPVGNSAETTFVRTNGSALNVRSAPGGAVIGFLPNGARVELTGRADGSWVERTNGTWISGDWLSATTGSNPPSANVGGPDAAAVVDTNGSPLLVRAQPAGAIVGQIANGSRITLSGRTSDVWVQLSSGDWVSSDWVTVLSR
ncbi:hypothetical protein [Vacuolonema iberomarrocanum]|uniref:SH3 domain-containing protein n=1 Tax=Vacuolonema iberomarrocanum TaxID=3454632 RepID=UPI0019F474D0|nr:hypothetical protein [filamentous cyanobacterium LEGE 07170]